MGVEQQTSNYSLRVKMKGYTVLLVIVGLGCVVADTNLLGSPSAPVFSAQPPVDNSGYYSSYPSASGYDYDAGYLVYRSVWWNNHCNVSHGFSCCSSWSPGSPSSDCWNNQDFRVCASRDYFA